MYKFVLAARYLIKRRISYFCMAATALSVFVVLVVMTVLSGLTSEFKTGMHNAVGDCVVNSNSLVGFGYYGEFMDVLSSSEIVAGASAVIRNYAFVSGFPALGTEGLGEGWPRQIVGINPVRHSKVTAFEDWLYHNKDDVANVFEPPYAPGYPGCVPGVGFLFMRDSDGRFNINERLPRVSSEIRCFPLTTKGAPAKAGLGEVNTKTFYCSDHVQTGTREDWLVVYLGFEEAQQLCGMTLGLKRVNAVHIKFTPDVGINQGCERIEQLWEDFVDGKEDAAFANLFDNVRVESWKTFSRESVAAVETEQTMMILVFAMIGIITVFVVFVVFYMIVNHKSKDIGILKSVGVSNGNVMGLFVSFGFLVGATGSLAGALAGWQFLLHINAVEDWLYERFDFQLWDRTVYVITDIPNTIDIKVLAGIILSAIFACLAGSVIPSWRAAGFNPVDTLRVSRL